MGTDSPDDAGVYRLGDDLALVFTVDFFTPVVDDARTYGRIAAANSLSDVYAMGGEPFAALNVAGFPAASPDLPLALLGDILEGGGEVAREAGVVVLGGHTVDDPEPKFGLAVVGRVHPDRIIRKSGAQPGDRLVLTKPLGTGILTTALKRGLLEEPDLEEAVRVMSTLNRDACRAMTKVGVNAGTDVTGYGLLGHLGEMLRLGKVGARLDWSALPWLGQVEKMATAGAIPAGSRKNLLAANEFTTFADSISAMQRIMIADAQTSGGLLLAVAPEKAGDLVERLRTVGTPASAVIGEITGDPGRLFVSGA